MKILVCSVLLFAIFGGLISLPLDVTVEEPELSGAEIAALLKNGTRVVRGKDWKWGDQDGGAGSVGTVVADLDSDGWIEVKWDNADPDEYRMGFEGYYDLQLAPQTASQYKSKSEIYSRLG